MMIDGIDQEIRPRAYLLTYLLVFLITFVLVRLTWFVILSYIL